MALTVYLSNTEIQILSGAGTSKNVTVRNVYTMKTPEGSILNGVITDAAALSSALKDFWKTNRLPKTGIQLIVNSPQFMVRLMEIPTLSPQKSLAFLKREFVDIERTKKPVIGFFVMGNDKKTKKTQVCAELAEYDFIDTYNQIFTDAGITLSQVNSGVGMAVNLLQRTEEIKGKTVVVMLLDGMTLTSILFVKGEYYYSSSTRLFSDHGTPEFGREIAGVVSQLEQFTKAQHVEDVITEVAVGGIENEDEEPCRDALTAQEPDSDIHIIIQPKNVTLQDPSLPFQKIVYPTAGLMKLEGHQNVLALVREMSPKAEKRKAAIRKYAPYAFVTAALVIATLVLVVLNMMRGSYLGELNDYNTNPSNLSAASEYDAEASKAAILTQHDDGLKLLARNINSYPWMNSTVAAEINSSASGLADVVINSYDAASGVLSMKATASNVESINQFIAKLMQSSLFTDVAYTGYTWQESSNNWAINVTTTLSENAGKPADMTTSAASGTSSSDSAIPAESVAAS